MKDIRIRLEHSNFGTLKGVVDIDQDTYFFNEWQYVAQSWKKMEESGLSLQAIETLKKLRKDRKQNKIFPTVGILKEQFHNGKGVSYRAVGSMMMLKRINDTWEVFIDKVDEQGNVTDSFQTAITKRDRVDIGDRYFVDIEVVKQVKKDSWTRQFMQELRLCDQEGISQEQYIAARTSEADPDIMRRLGANNQ